MSYSVQFLDDAQFEALPGHDMQSKVGVAYPATGRAYVRKSGMTAMDVFNAAHELEHLKGDHLGEHFDSENGCYYKGFGSILSAVAPLALSVMFPGIGSALGGALGSLGGGLSSIGGGIASGLGAISPALGGAAQSIGGALGSIGNGIGGALGIGGSGGSGAGAGGAKSLGLHGFAGPEGPMGAMSTTGESFSAPNVLHTGAGLGMQGWGSPESHLGPQQASMGGGGGLGNALSLGSQPWGAPEGPMGAFQMPEMGSSSPDINQSPSANVIAGASGSGAGGGAGGAPGATGAGGASKIKQFLSSQEGGQK